MSSKTTNLELNYNYNKNIETTKSFLDGNNENWQIIDEKIGLVLNQMSDTITDLETIIDIDSSNNYDDYYKLVTTLVDLKNQLYNYLAMKGEIVTSNDTLNSLIAKVSNLSINDYYKSLILCTATSYSNSLNVTEIAPYTFTNFTTLRSVDLNGIATLGDSAFSGCTNLSQVQNINTVQHIGQSAFKKCNISGTLDLSSLLDTTLASYSFFKNNNRNFGKIILPSTLTTLDNYSLAAGDFYSGSAPDYNYVSDINLNNIEVFGEYCLCGFARGSNGTININSNSAVTVYKGALAYCRIDSFVAPTVNVTIDSDYIFYRSNCGRFEAKIVQTDLDTYTLSGPENFFTDSNISTIDLKDSILNAGRYFFDGCRYCTSINVTNCNFKSIDNYFMRYLGYNRYPLTNRLSVDLRNSTFTDVPQYAFYGLKNTLIYLPTSCNYRIGQYGFANCSDLKLVLTQESGIIPLYSTNCFQNNTNLKVFTPYVTIENLKSANYWSTYEANIYGHMNGTAVISQYGSQFPTATPNNTYTLTWYEDTDFTTLATTPVNGVEYYCTTTLVSSS